MKNLSLLEVSFLSTMSASLRTFPCTYPEKNWGTQVLYQRQPTYSKETSTIPKFGKQCFSVILCGEGRAHNLTYKLFANLPDTVCRKAWLAHKSFYPHLFFITKGIHAPLTFRRLNAGPGTIVLPTC